MDLGIKGKVAVVTGGSRGLGRISALALAHEGVNVAICGRTQSTLDTTVAELKSEGGSAVGIVADIGEPSSAPDVVQRAEEALGPVDILVNNVGGRRGTSMMETTEEQFKESFEVNLFGALRLMKLVVLECRNANGGASSILLPSGVGSTADRLTTWRVKQPSSQLQSSQLSRWSKTMCWSTASHQGPSSSRRKLGQVHKPEHSRGGRRVHHQEPARRALRLARTCGGHRAFLASERASLITGACINVDGGQSKSLI